MTCQTCGHELQVGEFPWCPHGRYTPNVIPDNFNGPQVIENLDHHPVTVRSRSELKREMDKRGLIPFVRHQPKQGSDKSDHTSRWV